MTLVIIISVHGGNVDASVELEGEVCVHVLLFPGNPDSLCCLPSSSNQQLISSLVRCLKAVADSYNPAILDTTIPSNLFGSLVKLLAVKDPGKFTME